MAGEHSLLPALLIVFREVIEAGLIVGIVLVATRGIVGRGRVVTLGVVAGVAGACLLAAFAGEVGAMFAGSGQELFQAAVLLAAVVMLIWHNATMAKHGREMSRDLRALGAEIGEGSRPLAALGVVVAVAVLREGAEIVLFLYGIAAGGDASAASMLTGGLLGLACGAGVAWLMYRGLLAIPAHRLLSVTGWLIVLLAAGMAATAVGFLQQAGYLAVLDRPLWDTSGVLDEGSIAGRVAHALVGYTDQPDGLQLLAWLATILVARVSARPKRAVSSARQPAEARR